MSLRFSGVSRDIMHVEDIARSARSLEAKQRWEWYAAERRSLVLSDAIFFQFIIDFEFSLIRKT